MSYDIRSSRVLAGILVAAGMLAASCSKPEPSAPVGTGAPNPARDLTPKPPVRLAVADEVNGMPSIATLGRRVVVVWTATKGAAMNVYAATSEDGGATFPVQARVNDQPGDASANVEQPPRVAVSPSGISVVWSSRKSGTPAIRMARSKDGGKTFGAAVTIHDPALTGARGWESIAAGADGAVHVVWLDGRNAAQRTAVTPPPASAAPGHMGHRVSPRQDVYEAVIDESGTIVETQVAADVCFCCKTAVAVGADGRIATAWRNIFPGSIRDIAMAVSTDGGRGFGPLARVSEDKWEIAGCPEDGPALAIDAANTVHAVWPTVVSDAQPQKVVFYASTKDGRTFTSRFRLSADDREEASHPQLAVAASGVVGTAWDEPYENGRQVIFRTRGVDGEWSERRVLSSETASHPVLAPTGDGFLAAWTSGEPAASAILVQQVVSP